MESIEVLEEGKLLSFRFDEMLNYHGPGFPGGVAHGFKVMQRGRFRCWTTGTCWSAGRSRS